MKDSVEKNIVVKATVKPRSHQAFVEEIAPNEVLIRVKSAPEGGKANAEVVALLAKHFGCSKADVEIKTGSGSRKKIIRIKR